MSACWSGWRTKASRQRHGGEGSGVEWHAEEGWGFAFHAYRCERYELSIFPSGEFIGPPEDAFEAAARAYLR